jgi:hypothetical protein
MSIHKQQQQKETLLASTAFVETTGKTAPRPTKGNRLAQLVRLQEAAISIVQQAGEWKPVRCADREVRIMCAEHGNLSIMYKTPFQKLWTSLPAGAPKPTGYLLDVRCSSQGKKVLSLLWDDNAPIIVVAFRRGDWERELLSHGDMPRQQAA